MTAQTDRFVHDRLPSRSDWPVFIYAPGSSTGEQPLNLIHELLDKSLQAPWADKVLFRDPNQTITYREANALVNQRALAILHMGLEPGNRVLLRGTNSIGFALAWLAIVKAGLVAVATMPLLRAKELNEIILKAQPQLVLCDVALLIEMNIARDAHGKSLPLIPFGDAVAPHGLESLSANQPDKFEACATIGDDIALLAFTSGTTGLPKVACHSHLDVWSACKAWPSHVLNSTHNDVVVGSPPLAFTFGLGGLLLFPMTVGASVYFAQGPLNPETMVKAMQDAACTICYTAPTFYRHMAAVIAAQPVPSLRISVSAGEALPDATRQLWKSATGLEMVDGIGATELFHIFISSAAENVRAGTIGQVVPGYLACVMSETGEELPYGQIGILAVRGPTGCKYLSDQRQKSYVHNGWNITGDMVMQDIDGYIHYQSRSDDMIISAGYNIGGPEVEDALLSHPAVAECGVVGKPDAERGMVVQAFCVLSKGYEPGPELIKLLQDHVKSTLAPYKYPRDMVFLNQLPRTPTGKLQRFKLRDLNPT